MAPTLVSRIGGACPSHSSQIPLESFLDQHGVTDLLHIEIAMRSIGGRTVATSALLRDNQPQVPDPFDSIVVKIEFGEWPPDGHLRHAKCTGLRDEARLWPKANPVDWSPASGWYDAPQPTAADASAYDAHRG